MRELREFLDLARGLEFGDHPEALKEKVRKVAAAPKPESKDKATS